jgi:Malate:quinone oxidoreductase (Mqo)
MGCWTSPQGIRKRRQQPKLRMRLENVLSNRSSRTRDEGRFLYLYLYLYLYLPDPGRGGILEFGTELVSAEDRSLVALLGASPGASTAAFIALEVIERCFPDELTEQA